MFVSYFCLTGISNTFCSKSTCRFSANIHPPTHFTFFFFNDFHNTLHTSIHKFPVVWEWSGLLTMITSRKLIFPWTSFLSLSSVFLCIVFNSYILSALIGGCKISHPHTAIMSVSCFANQVSLCWTKNSGNNPENVQPTPTHFCLYYSWKPIFNHITHLSTGFSLHIYIIYWHNHAKVHVIYTVIYTVTSKLIFNRLVFHWHQRR